MIAALLLLAAAPADKLDCASGDLPQQGLNQCALRDFEGADAAMNAQWRLTVEAMKARDRELAGDPDLKDGQPGYFETLLAGQRAWLTYRDQQCLAASFEMRGGSAQPMLDSGCRTTLTQERTKQLKALVGTDN